MKKIYYLKSCSTCLRIMNDIGVDDSWDQQNIRTEKITPKQLTEMKKRSGSYESLFSRTAMKYKQMNLKEKTLTEADYKKLILEHDTFLKRPVVLLDDQIFIGNGKKTIQSIIDYLSK